MGTSDLGVGTGGVWTPAQARRCGLSDDQVRQLLASGQWQRLRRGVLTDGGIEPDAAMRGWAAVVTASGTGGTGPPAAWATGRTTARLLGLPLIDDDDPATGVLDRVHDDVRVAPTRRPSQRETLRIHRGVLGPDGLGAGGSCPTVTLGEALLPLAAVLTFEALVCLLDAALHRHLLDRSALQAVVERSAGRPHCATLRTAATLADPRAESPAETLARLLLRPVLPGLEPQVPLQDRSGRVLARFDLADEQLRLAVEADGRRGHAGGEMVAKDRFRDATARGNGWSTERCTWWELRRRPGEFRARVVARAVELAART